MIYFKLSRENHSVCRHGTSNSVRLGRLGRGIWTLTLAETDKVTLSKPTETCITKQIQVNTYITPDINKCGQIEFKHLQRISLTVFIKVVIWPGLWPQLVSTVNPLEEEEGNKEEEEWEEEEKQEEYNKEDKKEEEEEEEEDKEEEEDDKEEEEDEDENQ